MPKPIRLAIAGVGNCASSLIQGITYYRDASPTTWCPGSCMWSWVATTSATCSRWPPSTSTRPRSGPTWARPSMPG